MPHLSRSEDVWPDFIVFEGLDGAGTTTQAQRLTEYLGREGQAEFTCEPTDFATGTVIRRLLKGPEYVRPETLALLFAADRNEHLFRPNQGIKDRLAAGHVVVCDRYLFSSLAYQGYLAETGLVERLNAGFPLPQHLFFIDTSLDEAHRRISLREERDSLETREIQEQVALRYRRVIRDFSLLPPVQRGDMKIHTLSGDRSEDDIFHDVLAALSLEEHRPEGGT
ncbi:dTMP kinase [Alkalispirochaeta americana]|uniref:Thymidylate kinase n=1 Tax=Alkalispirochaeta americana TaxID=159291 RepID=A0A1N6P9E0_9SPIO|nr:dTMP kinase [Alkalispirochaeta americana]SIQ00877.1 dTMP kinase [Alkalispirochaeta americana]